MTYKAIVIGTSAGGLNVLKSLLPALPANFNLPLIIVQHVGANSDSSWIAILNSTCKLNLREAEEKEPIEKGNVYIAPPNYHLLIEKDLTLSFSMEPKINFARPAIDVLFESAAEAYKDKLIGIILTGSNSDGTAGMKKIKEHGGLTIIQDPESAESPYVPSSVLNTISVDYKLSIQNIVSLLLTLSRSSNKT